MGSKTISQTPTLPHSQCLPRILKLLLPCLPLRHLWKLVRSLSSPFKSLGRWNFLRTKRLTMLTTFQVILTVRTAWSGSVRLSAPRPRMPLLRGKWDWTSTMLPTLLPLSMWLATLLCRLASALPLLSLLPPSSELPGLQGELVPRTLVQLKAAPSLLCCCPLSILSSISLAFILLLLWRTLPSRILSLVLSLSPQSRSLAR